MKNFISYMLWISTLIWSCNTPEPTKETSSEHEHAETTPTEEVHLVQQQMAVMGIQLGKFQYLNLSTTIKASGQMELPPQNRASLSSVMGGRVTKINVIEGDQVAQGQVLALLEHPDFIELQEQYLTTKSALRFATQNYQRQQKLIADSAIALEDFQETEANYMTAKAQVESMKTQLRLLDIDPTTVSENHLHQSIPIRSPLNGYVHLIQVNLGKSVLPEQELFEIVDNDHIHIGLMVYEKDIHRVQEDQKVIFSLSDKPDSVFEGRIFAVGKSFEAAPRAVAVHAEIDNKTGNLLPGMYVDARIITDQRKVRSLPNDAIVSDGGLSYVFVCKKGSKHSHSHGDDHKHSHNEEYVFRKVEVNTGTSDMGFTEVVPAEKLSEKATIVTKGAFYLLAEMKKGSGKHGHHH